MPRRDSWPPGRDLSDERLAFLAARTQLERRSRSRWWWLLRILEAGSGGSRGTVGQVGAAAPRSIAAEVRSNRLNDYVVACDLVASRLTGAERMALRLRGALPDRFYDEVEAEVRTLRSERRH